MKVKVITAVILFLLGIFDDPFKTNRERMVNLQIRARGVKNEAVLNAMRKVPRHLFVPKSRISEAYDDGPVPIGYGQTISQPFIVAYMTEVIEPEKCKKVLEIGTGSGYQAAILAEIVDSVFTIEIITELYKEAKDRLEKLGYKNIKVKNADGYYGWKEHAPFDAIVVTAAAEFVPPPLIEQLKEGGKMVIPVGSPFYTQNLILVEKKDGKVFSKNLIPVRFVPFVRGK
ncbi:MAG: protein-L-isoaspartate(D-aspartate) O-methyltransferase [Ignavibacteria bacterium]|jgi:protein-L-isoaspartate(D-aspartate) O-methyltransferase|nr:protein-L-isoaspartate(D-aspartate) O-methyltransferase [Ignavibacteria bacterium]MDH7528754.1 protein-L-isoaspartate(D-aspartate) O-methyltransferase [Ignavibacteria bacterium]NPV10252.1 protein-L-isoaspartate(D-aspartate) O-methyltransferase [Ignavibacteria bacterium]